MNDSLDQLLEHPGIWRAGEPAHNAALDHVATGYPAMDAALPGGGWPRGALSEVLHEHSGIGELRLLMPALARLSHQGRWVALIAPPHIPYAPALKRSGVDLSHVLLVHPRSSTDTLWALEQALRTGTCGAVLAWPRQIDDRSLRRLQLAAEQGGTLGVLFRSSTAGDQPSPAALRLQLTRQPGQTPMAHILKCRGGGRINDLPVDLDGADSTAASPERPVVAPEPARKQPEPVAASTATGEAASSGRVRPGRGGRRRATQMDLPLTPPERPGRHPQATPVSNARLEARHRHRRHGLMDKLR